MRDGKTKDEEIKSRKVFKPTKEKEESRYIYFILYIKNRIKR
jgi:hypothetical protein